MRHPLTMMRARVRDSHVDNYCHGLIIAEQALYPGSRALGKFYIVTGTTLTPRKTLVAVATD